MEEQTMQTGSEPAGVPSPEPQAPTTGGDPRESLQNPLLTLDQQGNPGVPNEPQQVEDNTGTPPAPQQDLLLGKFRTPEELANSYLEAQRKITEQGQQIAQIQQQVSQQQINQQPAPNEPPAPTPEQYAEMNEKFLNDFYENPLQVVAGLARDIAMEQVAPILRDHEQTKMVDTYNRQIQDAKTAHPDFENLVPEIKQVIEENSQYLSNVPNPVEVAYNLAKGRQAQTLTPENLLQDADFRQRIMQDEAIRNEIIKNYAGQVKANQPPVVIGSQPSSGVPATPPQNIQSTADAKRASISFFQRILGGGQ